MTKNESNITIHSTTALTITNETINKIITKAHILARRGIATSYNLTNLNNPVRVLKLLERKLPSTTGAHCILEDTHHNILKFIAHNNKQHAMTSVMLTNTPTKKILKALARAIHEKGTPGLFWKQRFGETHTSLCGEQALREGQTGVSTTINIEKHRREHVLNWNGIKNDITTTLAHLQRFPSRNKKVSFSITHLQSTLDILELPYNSRRSRMIAHHLLKRFTQLAGSTCLAPEAIDAPRGTHWKHQLLMLEACQNAIMESISTTITLPKRTTKKEIEMIITTADKKNVKGITLYCA